MRCVIPNALPTKPVRLDRKLLQTSLAQLTYSHANAISRVRSITDTGIIFITHYRPPPSEITATSVRSSCKVIVIFSRFSRRHPCSGKEILLTVAQESKRVSCCSASALSNPSFTPASNGVQLRLAHNSPGEAARKNGPINTQI